MSFTKEGHKHTLKGLKFNSSELISSHHMEKLLKKGHLSIISQFNAHPIYGQPPQKIHPDLQLVLNKHQ
jgi:hypothetical protein